MKITFSQDKKEHADLHQARTEQSFSLGDAHGDFCLTAYGQSREEARVNLRQLALAMVRELDKMKNL